LGVEPHPGADLGHPDRVGDELVARAPQLVGVSIAGEVEGAGDRLTIDVRCRGRCDRFADAVGVAVLARQRVELLDDGEKVAQELLVRYGCLCPSRNRLAS
jgi:hypothetical protein